MQNLEHVGYLLALQDSSHTCLKHLGVDTCHEKNSFKSFSLPFANILKQWQRA